jgi:tetratricopeptide (TPR) repeat protein
MTEVEKKGIGKAKVGLILCAVLLSILAVSNVWSFMMVERLQNQVNTLETEKNTLENQVIGLQSAYAALNASYVTLNANYTEMFMRFTNFSTSYANLTMFFGLLQENYTKLTENYNALSQNYTTLLTNYDALTSDYNILSGNYSTLLSVNQTLQEQYFALNDLYQQLQTNYETLENTYGNLSKQYETLLELWNEPLEYVVTPTWDEVIAWLETDQTNKISYDSEKFLCGDFSIMLIQHAKAMHWRMLFTVIEFDYYTENPNGTERHHGNYGHAFVSIFTTEGIVYIEPQTDYTWYLHETGDPETHVEFSDWEFVNLEGWFGHIFVQYYNRVATDIEPIKGTNTSIEVGFPH